MEDIEVSIVEPWAPEMQVGRYVLLAKLATGGMAEIFLARQAGEEGFEKVVVMKRILDSYSEDPEFVKMFLDEARIASQLSHPHIVQIYDLGKDRGSYFIAMEYLAGESLSSVARAGLAAGKPLPLTFAAKLIASAAEGLAYAHAKTDVHGRPLGIVHRDVSPQNLIVTYDGILKIVDFGIAKAANRASVTEAGKLKGKLGYMSPEQARGEALDGRADVFALGVCLFEAVTRRRLLKFDDPVQALAYLANGEAPLPAAREASPDVPPELDAIISRSIARGREQRFQTARELQNALEGWLRKQSHVPDTADIAQYVSGLFATKIRERANVIAAAAAGELTPSQLPRGVGHDTERSMPNALLPEKKPIWLWLAVGTALSIVLGASLFFLLGRGLGPGKLPGLATSVPHTPAASRLKVTTEPRGAVLTVDGTDRGPAPLDLDGLAAGPHVVLAKLEGRTPVERRVKLDEGETVVLDLTLPAAEAAKPSGTEPAKPAVRKGGFLTLDTQPWTEVFLGERKLGDTPLVNKPVPAGRLTLTLKNGDKGVKQVIEIEVQPGKTTRKTLHF